MAYVRLNEEVIITKEFYDYMIEGFRNHYGKKPEGLMVEDFKYKLWDDSDKPGITESLELKMNDGNSFRVHMVHNGWQSFKQLQLN